MSEEESKETDDNKAEDQAAAIAALEAKQQAAEAELERYKAKHAEAEKHLKETEKKLGEIEKKDTGKSSEEAEKAMASYEEKLAKIEAKYASDVKAMETTVIDAAARALASEIALDGSADVLMPHIRARLGATSEDGVSKVHVTVGGVKSTQSLDKLKEEIVANAAFAPVLKGSAANGTGSPSGKGEGAAVKTMKREAFDKLSDVAKREFVTTEKGQVHD